MLERELVELVTISKSAIKLKCVPWKHVVSGLPLRSLTPTTFATLTSLAVQFSASDCAVDPAAAPFAMLYSFCKQLLFCANAGAARTAIASTVQQNHKGFVPLLELMVFSPPIPPDGALGSCLGRPPGLNCVQSFFLETSLI